MQWKELVKCLAEIEDFGRGGRKVEIEPVNQKCTYDTISQYEPQTKDLVVK